MGRGASNKGLALALGLVLAALLPAPASAALLDPLTDPRDDWADRRLRRADEAVWQTLFGQRVVREARKQLGRPYVWGDKTGRRGFDCSGFTAWVFNTLGVELGPSALMQYQQGVSIERAALMSGDLVFFTGQGSPLHVGIYEGQGRFLHAPGTGKVIESSELGSAYFTQHYIGARRLTPPLPPKEKKP